MVVRGQKIEGQNFDREHERFHSLDDEEILVLIHQGNSLALDFLIQKYRGFVQSEGKNVLFNRC